MSSCTVRRGFLTLRPCGEPAVAQCGSCGRPVCAGHLVARSEQGPEHGPERGPARAGPGSVVGGQGARPARGGGPDRIQGAAGDRAGALCAECSARQASADLSVSDNDWTPTEAWRFGYRDSYYRDSGYRPPSAGGAATGAAAGATIGAATGFHTGGAFGGEGPQSAAFQTGGTFDDLDREAFDPVLAAAGVLPDEDADPSLFDS